MALTTASSVPDTGSFPESDVVTPTSSNKLSPSQSSSGGNGHSNSKRPPRKSTLTQQQKNQKRQRATQDQLSILEMEFNKNPTPTAGVRERIADEINMTERSVQIWFQNRYVPPSVLAAPPEFGFAVRRLNFLFGVESMRLMLVIDEPKSSCWQRRVWKRVKISTLFQSL